MTRAEEKKSEHAPDLAKEVRLMLRPHSTIYSFSALRPGSLYCVDIYLALLVLEAKRIIGAGIFDVSKYMYRHKLSHFSQSAGTDKVDDRIGLGYAKSGYPFPVRSLEIASLPRRCD